MERESKTLELFYPREITANVDYRQNLVIECLKDIELASEVRLKCSNDILFWINVFCWTKDPRKDPDIIPFICYDAYQDDTILEIQKAIDEQYDLLGEKSRDMGLTWKVDYVLQHKFLFEDGSDFRIGSRKEEFVDRIGDIDTIFEKLRFNLEKQPKFLMPSGFDWRKHSGYMKLLNPHNSNAIIGEAANEDFGSGGRRKAVFLDEFSKWDKRVAEAAWTATADVTNCRIVVSTPKGSGNKFAILAKGTKEKIRKLTLHWTLHPEKSKGAYFFDKDGKTKIMIDLEDPRMAFNVWKRGTRVRSPWYDYECERRSETDVAQELDINYLQSGAPFFSINALSKQKAWKLCKRAIPMSPIPAFHYIQAIIVETDNKFELREVDGGWLKVFELPKKGMQYVNSGDTAEGLAKGDECFGVVRDKFTRNVVATYHGCISPDDFALRMQKVGQYYNNAKTAPENNNHGYSVCSDLKKEDCNLYYTRRIDNKGKVTIVKAGWSTTSASRPQMLDQTEEEIRKGTFEMRDGVLIAQCETFVKNEKTGKPEADGEYLDDGVIALAIGGMVIQEFPYEAAREKKTGTPQAQRPKNARFRFKKRV